MRIQHASQCLDIPFAMLIHEARMQPQADADVIACGTQRQHPGPVCAGGTRHHEMLHSRLSGPLEHRLAVMIEISEIKMTVSVDEHGKPQVVVAGVKESLESPQRVFQDQALQATARCNDRSASLRAECSSGRKDTAFPSPPPQCSLPPPFRAADG